MDVSSAEEGLSAGNRVGRSEQLLQTDGGGDGVTKRSSAMDVEQSGVACGVTEWSALMELWNGVIKWNGLTAQRMAGRGQRRRGGAGVASEWRPRSNGMKYGMEQWSD